MNNLLAGQDPKAYIEKGYIHLRDNVAFRTMVDAANCFGNNYKPKALWGGSAKHPKEAGKIIWFPKLYRNGEWNNRISDDETIIWEVNESPEKAKKHIDAELKKGFYNRIVFPRIKGPLGDLMYRFKGEYQLDQQATNYQEGLVWRRVSEWAKTYQPD